MATTPNYGWVMPDPTDFVTNLPADFEVFGDAVDLTVDGIDTRVTDLEVIAAEGDLIIGDASGDPVALPIGSAGQILASDGDTAEWITPTAGGGMTLIATATPSAATTVSFTSIPTTYKSLLLVWNSVFQSATDQYFVVRFNSDSGNNYYGNVTGINNNSFSISGPSTHSSIGGTSEARAPIPTTATSNTDLAQTSNGMMWIYNADQTTSPKKVWYSSSGYSGSTFSTYGAISANYQYEGTSAISQIDFIRSSTQTITGTIRLYGVS
jgi:hypothetical protein